MIERISSFRMVRTVSEGEKNALLHAVSEKSGELVWQLVVPKLKSGKVNDWENLGLLSSATVKVEGAGAQDVAATDMWTEAHQCLPSARAGGPSSLTFSVSSSEYSGHSQIDVDDVSVGSDPACP